jgi:hypothetical protein
MVFLGENKIGPRLAVTVEEVLLLNQAIVVGEDGACVVL